MTNDIDWLNLYKDKCRNYYGYEADLKKTKDELKQTINQIENVRSPITDRVGGHQTPHEEKLISLISMKTEIEKEIEYYQGVLDWIFFVCNKITSPAYRAITWQTLVQGKTKYDLMITYDVNANYVYDMRDKFLLRALDDEAKKRYEELLELKQSSKWLSLKDKKDK